MQIPSLVRLLPRSFLLILLLLVHAPLAASLQCWEASDWQPSMDASLDHPTLRVAGDHPSPIAEDCLRIASVLPSSLWFDPAIQAHHRTPTLNYGRLSTHRFDLPAVIRHMSCEVLVRGRLLDLPGRPGREFTREETAYYIWNIIKAELQKIVQECIVGTGKQGGTGILTEQLAGLGLPETMRDSVAVVMVYPTGSQRLPRDEIHVYNV